MVEKLVWEDYMTIGIYFAIVLAVGLWSTCRPNRGSTTGYFLAGKNMHWIPIGASVYASNVGAPMFIGLAGTAAAMGFSVTIYEWHVSSVFLKADGLTDTKY
ncbi:sodium/glucose cotransporter 5-like [Mercenaria mercenaria]|uniref:sodium/glucose cotransporter 5-like n=1 Tax=Mercenaria mercenaria TaxID=6596 RepID=UPI00234EE2E2|nr:sodium/glucose cotransporter 5-like [Mercenaria mercenaria]